MKARPILFSTPMIQALLEGRKTQTRRSIKPQPYKISGETFAWNGVKGGQGYNWPAEHKEFSKHFKQWCPYGKIGDLLWVREKFCLGSIEAGDHYPESPEPLFVEQCEKENIIPYEYCIRNNIGIEEVKWKPSIFMPKWASRITLEITNIRVERLQDISENDAEAEGAQLGRYRYDTLDGEIWKNGTYKLGYYQLWETINGKDSWEKNPWVWVLEFKIHKCNFQELIK